MLWPAGKASSAQQTCCLAGTPDRAHKRQNLCRVGNAARTKPWVQSPGLLSQALQCMSPVLGTQRQEELKFKVIFSYITTLRLVWTA